MAGLVGCGEGRGGELGRVWGGRRACLAARPVPFFREYVLCGRPPFVSGGGQRGQSHSHLRAVAEVHGGGILGGPPFRIVSSSVLVGYG